jgi:probable rRNA maturation factor
MKGSLDIRNLTRRKAPAFAFRKAHRAVLPSFEVSLAFLTSAQAQKLNKQLRKKAYVPNVLSYRTGEKSGEIVICLEEMAKQAPAFGLTPARVAGFLFIHGLLHLEGRQHGRTMERTERKLFERVAGIPFPYEAPHSHRNRHRDPAGQDSRR